MQPKNKIILDEARRVVSDYYASGRMKLFSQLEQDDIMRFLYIALMVIDDLEKELHTDTSFTV